MECEHKPEWIRMDRERGFYCTVCRAKLYEQTKLFEVKKLKFWKQGEDGKFRSSDGDIRE